MPGMTLSAFANRVYQRLNEPASTTVPQLDSGTSSSPTITPIASIVDLYNYASAELARNCIPLWGTGQQATYTIGLASYPLASLSSVTSGLSALWSAGSVLYNGVALAPVGYAALNNWLQQSGGVGNVTTGTPTWFANLSDNQSFGTILIGPRPSASQTLLVEGLGLPSLAVDGNSTIDWIGPDLIAILEYRVSALVAAKNIDDPTMIPRVDLWNGMYYRKCEEIWMRMPPDFRRWHYPSNPNPNPAAA